MKGINLLYIFWFIYFPTFAQLISIVPTENYSPDIRFNSDYVKENKIKKITCKVIHKPDNKVMEDKGQIRSYEFNIAGNVKRSYYTTVKGVQTIEKFKPAVYKRGKLIIPGQREESVKFIYDTTFTYFYYDSKQNLIMKRSSTVADYFNTVYYTYDTLNRVVKIVSCKETNNGATVHEFLLGVQTVLSSESFEYIVQNEQQVKKRCFNDNGKVYKEAIVTLSPLLRTEVYVFAVGSLRLTNFFNYKEDGTLVESVYDSNAEDNMQYKCSYEYKGKQPVVEKIYKNNVKIHEINYLYDRETEYLKSSVKRNFIENTIDILKFDYQFYE